MRNSDAAVPGLLVRFFAATLTMVVAVALLLRGDHGWDDAVAFVLLLALLAFVLRATSRAASDDGDGRSGGEGRDRMDD